MIEIGSASMVFAKRGIGKADANDGFKALDNITITIPDGCIYGFLGSNGAGKSTLLRMLCGVYKTEQGSIKIDGEDVFDNRPVRKIYARWSCKILRKLLRQLFFRDIRAPCKSASAPTRQAHERVLQGNEAPGGRDNRTFLQHKIPAP